MYIYTLNCIRCSKAKKKDLPKKLYIKPLLTNIHVLQSTHNIFKKKLKIQLPYDIASGSEIMPCNKICKPLVKRYGVHNNVAYIMTTL